MHKGCVPLSASQSRLRHPQTHISVWMKAMRLSTVALASEASCFTSTRPNSLYTVAGSFASSW